MAHRPETCIGLCRQHREVFPDERPSDREHVLPVVLRPPIRGLLLPLREANLHHKRGPEDILGRRLTPGRPDARRTQRPPDHTTIHRRRSGSSAPGRRSSITDAGTLRILINRRLRKWAVRFRGSVRRARLSVFCSELAKEAAIIRPHPLFHQTTFVVKTKDI